MSGEEKYRQHEVADDKTKQGRNPQRYNKFNVINPTIMILSRGK